jgi:hypothetical protein
MFEYMYWDDRDPILEFEIFDGTKHKKCALK